MRKKDGFTLVELIVVIAILAILAGVAIPAYSGYINKANQAADNMLIAAINTAAAAAVMEVDQKSMSTMNDGDLEYEAGGLSPAKFDAAFRRYFAGNDGTLKYFSGVEFVDGAFRGIGEGGSSKQSIVVAGKTYTYTQAQVDAYKNSNYNKVQPSELTNSVDSLATALGDNTTGLEALANTASFKAKLVELGIVDADTTITAAMLSGDPTLAKEVANASVLYVAKVASSMNPDDVYDAFVNGTLNDLVEGSGMDTTFMTAALQYGLLTAFVNTNYGSAFKDDFVSDSNNVRGLTDVANLFDKYTNDEDSGTYNRYRKYIASNSAADDIKGFLSALSIINENASNFDLSSVYSDEDIINAINTILGNGN